ncbi:hypothetical protein FRC04_001178 [Tulasnella sp. 424]|nr:hypothetical protein FRC04_001178 [Tulasnella sp. 424]
MACSGDSSLKCGNSYVNSLYGKASGVSTLTAPAGWTQLGCYIDQSSRTLNQASTSDSTGMTLEVDGVPEEWSNLGIFKLVFIFLVLDFDYLFYLFNFVVLVNILVFVNVVGLVYLKFRIHHHLIHLRLFNRLFAPRSNRMDQPRMLPGPEQPPYSHRLKQVGLDRFEFDVWRELQDKRLSAGGWFEFEFKFSRVVVFLYVGVVFRFLDCDFNRNFLLRLNHFLSILDLLHLIHFLNLLNLRHIHIERAIHKLRLFHQLHRIRIPHSMDQPGLLRRPIRAHAQRL